MLVDIIRKVFYRNFFCVEFFVSVRQRDYVSLVYREDIAIGRYDTKINGRVSAFVSAEAIVIPWTLSKECNDGKYDVVSSREEYQLHFLTEGANKQFHGCRTIMFLSEIPISRVFNVQVLLWVSFQEHG